MDIQQLDKDVSDVVQSAWSSNTLMTRNSQWKRYLHFCSDIGAIPLPANTKTIGRFLVHLSKDCKYSTINNYLSAIVSLHKFYGYVPDFRESFYIKMILRGLKNKLGTHSDQKQPFSIEQLRLMYLTLDVASTTDEILWTILITSFRSLLRKSNLVPTCDTDMKHVLLRKDVLFHSWGMMLHVRSTKTLQHGEYVLEIPIYFVDDVMFCAARAVRKHILYYPADDSCPLFFKRTATCLQPVYYSELLSFIKRLSTNIGLDPKLYGCHSLRRAGAQYMNSKDIPLHDIMCVGNWHSMSVLDYLVTPLNRRMDIQAKLSHYLS